jgi:hypothetical protein
MKRRLPKPRRGEGEPACRPANLVTREAIGEHSQVSRSSLLRTALISSGAISTW